MAKGHFGKALDADPKLVKAHVNLVLALKNGRARRLSAENKVRQVRIDTESGAVIDMEEEKPSKDMKRERKQERKREPQL